MTYCALQARLPRPHCANNTTNPIETRGKRSATAKITLRKSLITKGSRKTTVEDPLSSQRENVTLLPKRLCHPPC